MSAAARTSSMKDWGNFGIVAGLGLESRTSYSTAAPGWPCAGRRERDGFSAAAAVGGPADAARPTRPDPTPAGREPGGKRYPDSSDVLLRTRVARAGVRPP